MMTETSKKMLVIAFLGAIEALGVPIVLRTNTYMPAYSIIYMTIAGVILIQLLSWEFLCYACSIFRYKKTDSTQDGETIFIIFQIIWIVLFLVIDWQAYMLHHH